MYAFASVKLFCNVTVAVRPSFAYSTDLTGISTELSAAFTVISSFVYCGVAAENVAVKALEAVCVTPVSCATASFTVTSCVATRLFDPTLAVAVIVAVPALTPVTTPLASTVATVASLDAYVTFALAGLTATVSAAVAPVVTSVAPDNFRDGFLTVTLQV